MQYTEEEKIEIEKAFVTVLNDMIEVYKTLEEFRISLQIYFSSLVRSELFGYQSTLYLQLDQIKFKLSNSPDSIIGNKTLVNDPLGKKKIVANIFPLEFKSEFIRSYPNIRKQIIDTVTSKRNRIAREKEQRERIHKEEMAAIRNIEKKYSESVDIEINFPPSQNQHKVEVKEENGCKVGTINFGDRTIRIITSGDIVLVDKSESKMKKKEVNL